MLEWCESIAFNASQPYWWNSILFFNSFINYFIMYRGRVKKIFVAPLKRSKKEQKAYQAMLWSSSAKELAKRFFNWILCRCYTKEQKKRGYSFFLAVNYLYIFLKLGLTILWLVGLFVPSARIVFLAFFGLVITFIEFPILCAGSVMGYRSRREHYRRHKWDLQ